MLPYCYKAEYKGGNEEFGLSDKAIETLKKIKNQQLKGDIFEYPYEEPLKLENFKGADFVNFILTDYVRELAYYVDYYFSVIKYHQRKNDKIGRRDDFGNPKPDELGIDEAKYRISQSMDRFLERITQELLYWERK